MRKTRRDRRGVEGQDQHHDGTVGKQPQQGGRPEATNQRQQPKSDGGRENCHGIARKAKGPRRNTGS